uniref:tyrosine-type recombinase/integrase n=1 Tax=Lactobacillus acetotolerans TaxID=1600 RepID=UPI002FD8E4F1
MANIKKRGKYWQARIGYYSPDGKRHTKSKSGFTTKKEAELFANTYEIKSSNGELTEKGAPLFYEYFWDWFETYKASGVRERTRLTYLQVYNVLKKYFPHTKIDELDRRKYQQFIKKYGSKHAKSTVSKSNSLIHASIKDAVYDGIIKKDFVANTSLVYNKAHTKKIDYLSIKDMQTLATHLTDSLNWHFTSKYMILLAMFTGMRLGEIQGLKWSDLNFNFHTISIKRSWNETDKNFQDTKNESSKRIIRVNPEILDLLKQLKQNKSSQVFTCQYGTIPTSSAVNKVLRESLKECGINRPGFHFHSLRHTHVAYLLANNI